MSFFDLETSNIRALARVRNPGRRDRGQFRLSEAVRGELDRLLGGRDRPRVQDVARDLQRYCKVRGERCPSRATIYKYVKHSPPPPVDARTLPSAVRGALYNVDLDAQVPLHQVAFGCFNYGDLDALSFGAGLPWRALQHAASMRGWRPKSRSLFEAVLRTRGL